MTTPIEEAGNNFSEEIDFSGFNDNIDKLNTSIYNLDLSINDTPDINSSDIKNKLNNYIKNNNSLLNKNKSNSNSSKNSLFSLYNTNLNSTKIKNMINDHEDIKDDMNIYQGKRQELIKLIGKHDVLTTKLSNAKSNNNYLFFMVWTIILVIVSFSVFVNVVDDKQEMSSLTKILFITLFAYITYLVIKNILNINM